MHSSIDHRFSVAPMLDWTDRHCRFFFRQLSQRAVLYTEMVTTGAILHGKGDYLSFNQEEHPVVLQLGGSDPTAMAACAEIAQRRGYDEVNINVGCPSDRVKNGSFGACLMASPNIVAECVQRMQERVSIPITVKCRIGIDDMDEHQGLYQFVETVANAGCKHFVVHARKAWLQGLSPKQNRDIPPLNYHRVYSLKQEFPHIQVSLNGGITSLNSAIEHLDKIDGVMLGREVYSNPFILADVDRVIFSQPSISTPSRRVVIEKMTHYLGQQIDQGEKAWFVVRHMLGLFQGQVGGKIWRRFLTQQCPKNNHNPEILMLAYEQVEATQQKALIFSQND